MRSATADIPLSFNPDAPNHRNELERLASAMDTYVRGAPDQFTPRETLARTPNQTRAAFGETLRLNLATDATHDFFFPRPDVANAGKILYVQRQSDEGIVTGYAVDCLIGDATTYIVPNDIGMYAFLFDGTNYYPLQPGGTGSGL